MINRTDRAVSSKSLICICWMGIVPILLLLIHGPIPAQPPREAPNTKTLSVNIPHIATDKTVAYDYDIVYVRAKRVGDKVHKRFYTDFSQPVTIESGADLMLLHPDGKEELLVAGREGSITDPMVSFDGQWVYYVHLYNLAKRDQWSPPAEGADIFKINLKTRKKVRLTNQVFTPNTGAADWCADRRKPAPEETNKKTYFSYGVFNMGPCPLPGGRLVFTSNRDGFRPSKGYPVTALQLFVMDDRDTDIDPQEAYPANIEKIGHINVAGALHPVALADGRIMFSTLESQGLRSDILWGIWTIHPDGTNWAPLVSAFDPGGAPNGFHFQTQLGDGSIIFEKYYNQNNSGFGALMKMPPSPPDGYPAFGPAFMNDPRNQGWRNGRNSEGRASHYRMPFLPTASVAFTPFTHGFEGPAPQADLKDKDSPKLGKFTHPSGAPNNHMLTVYSPGPVNHQYTFLPQLDGGIYLIKDGKPVEEPAQMLLIKNDPEYNECWPRAVVPYKRIYGIDQPKPLAALPNDGQQSPHLPEGTPFGLVGTSSLYKRETYPNGVVKAGSVTATFAGERDPWKGLDPFTSHGNGPPLNWHNQGADAGLYANDDIHAIRILAQEPTTDRNRGFKSGRLFYNHASERMRILGEIPVRKFQTPGADATGLANATGFAKDQPLDPDNNPDTSFLAKIPADTPFTFQTIDKDGMVLNTAQTWHQVRPGEIRHNCGGCHAHSQQPTDFKLTAAAKPDYKVWDLVNQTPLVTAKKTDESKKKWDAGDSTGLRYVKSGPANVEYFRDIQPILKKSCVACHSAKDGRQPAAKLDLDADQESLSAEYKGKFPGTYYRLALDGNAKFGHKAVGWDSWGTMQASRYVRKMQSRRSLLTWKVFGKRLDGYSNGDHPSESEPGKGDLVQQGKQLEVNKYRAQQDVDYAGSVMPPPAAVAGTYQGPDGKKIKVEPLSDENKRTIVRWIDLGCPIDQDYAEPGASAPGGTNKESGIRGQESESKEQRGYGWMLDDNRPVLTLTYPQAGANKEISRLLVGMHDYYTGLDMGSFKVTADVNLAGLEAGQNLAARFKEKSQGVWELKLDQPIKDLTKGKLSVSIKDRQGNETRIERLFSVTPEKVRKAKVKSRK